MASLVAVCDGEGFGAAARRLGVSPSVVSRQVAWLEERLGVRLLERTTRSLRLTEAGATYLERARAILAELEEADTAAAGDLAEPRGRLAVSAPLIFGRLHVAPVLSSLMREHPGLTTELGLSDRYVSLVEEGYDAGVRIGALSDSGLIARRLGETHRVLVASPDYVARNGAPTSPADLPDFDLIAFSALAPTAEWRFRGETGDIRVRVAARFATDSADAAIGFARDGGGLGFALGYQVRDVIARGELVEVLAGFRPPAIPIQAVYPSSRRLSSRVRVFVDSMARAVEGKLG